MAESISKEALFVLCEAHYAANRLFITRDELPRDVYGEVKEVCVRIGGKWNAASKTFLFAYDPMPTLKVIGESGVMPSKNPLAYFATPPAIGEDIVRHGFNLWGCTHCDGYRHGVPLHACAYIPHGLRILEPSAGQGVIAKWIRQLYRMQERDDYTLHCCELNPINRIVLEQNGFNVVGNDFLSYHLDPKEPRYDLILANPPFHGLEFLAHVQHAWDLLSPKEGRLVCITPTSLLWRDDAQCQHVRKLIRCYGDEEPYVYKAGHFKESGTQVETMLISLVKRDMSWKMQQYEGYPNWHCYMLDFWVAQTKKLYDLRWSIWARIERGELAASSLSPNWAETRSVLHAFFNEVAEEAKQEWIEIDLDESTLHVMEQHFLALREAECPCQEQVRMRSREEPLDQKEICAPTSPPDTDPPDESKKQELCDTDPNHLPAKESFTFPVSDNYKQVPLFSL